MEHSVQPLETPGGEGDSVRQTSVFVVGMLTRKEDTRGNRRTEMTRVLQIPGTHPYIEQSVAGTAGPDFGSPTGIPSPAMDLSWLSEHHRELDAVHLHFGFEHLDPEQLQAWVDALMGFGLPLVYTAHDLRNPHQLSAEPHDRHLDILIPSAAAVFTLTPGAADEIRRRWGRLAEVVAHPYVIDPASRPARPGTDRVVGIHLKDLRRNVIEPDQIVAAALAGAIAGHGRLRVDVHPGVLDRSELAGLRRLGAAGELELAVHHRFSDQELAAYLAGLHVAVLPYRFGSHSGWLEACRDVGTRVVSPVSGFYAQQWDDVVTYHNDEATGLDAGSLTEAVRQALLRPVAGPVDADFRYRQRAEVRAVHTRVYADLASRHRVTS
jgi:hypothetical protein